jgi:hypothetical protein
MICWIILLTNGWRYYGPPLETPLSKLPIDPLVKTPPGIAAHHRLAGEGDTYEDFVERPSQHQPD